MEVRTRHFPLMDSMRAIAAITILLAHSSLWAGVYGDDAHPWLRQVCSRLEAAVAIFFLVSGFLLYRPFVAAALAEKKVDSRAYAWRRFLRIVPAYWVALTIIALVFGWHYIFTGHNFWRYYGFGQVYSVNTATGGISQAWTLCIEVTFYAFLPLWAFFMRNVIARRAKDTTARLKAEIAGVSALILFGFLWQFWIIHGDGHQVKTGRPTLISLPAFIDYLALGMLIAVLSIWWEHKGRTPRPIRLIERFPFVSWLAALGVFLVVCFALGFTGKFFEPVTVAQYMARHEAYGIIAMFVILPAVVGEAKQGLLRRWVLANPFLLWVGLISYGLYLWHQAVIGKLLDWNLAGHLHWLHPYARWPILGLAGGLVLGGLSYYLVERPAMSLKRLVPARRDSPPREALVEPAPLVPEVIASGASASDA